MPEAERPPNWREISPSGKPFDSGVHRQLSRRPSLRARVSRAISEEAKDEQWNQWEPRWSGWPYWAPCCECGCEAPMQAGGGAGAS